MDTIGKANAGGENFGTMKMMAPLTKEEEARRAQNQLRYPELREQQLQPPTPSSSSQPLLLPTPLQPRLQPQETEDRVNGNAPTPVTVPAPVSPTPEELQRHNVTHSPFAPWCPICVKAEAPDVPHRQLPVPEETDVPVVETDCSFLATATKGDALVPMLIADQKRRGYAFAAACRAKGRSDQEAIQGLCRFFTEAGFNGTVRLRSDPGPAIQAVAQEIAVRRTPAVTIVETTPVGSSSSLGACRRAHDPVDRWTSTSAMHRRRGEVEDQGHGRRADLSVDREARSVDP